MTEEAERAHVIAFLGIDGSGKSTQAKRIANWLQRAGHKVTYLKTSRGRSKLDRVARSNGFANLADYVGGESAALMNASLGWRSLYEIRQSFREPGAFVVIDRYMHCHAAMARIQAPAVEGKIRGLFRRYPEPDQTFYVHAPAAVAHARTLDRDGREVDTVDALAAFDRAYRGLPEFGTFIAVDGNRPPDEVQVEIRGLVAQRFGLPEEMLAAD